jgi:hypothetical protein
MLRKVLKRIPKGRGEYLESGTILDVSSWRNVKMLEAGRYLAKLTDEETKAHLASQKPAPAPKPASAPAPKKPKSAPVADAPVVEEDDK